MKWKYIAFFCVILLPFASCSKYYESRLVGTWERVYPDVVEGRPTSVWTFYPDGAFSVQNDESWGSPRGEYEVTTKSVVVAQVVIKSPFDLEGTYQCDQINKDILTMTRRQHAGTTDSAFLRIELIKAK